MGAIGLKKVLVIGPMGTVSAGPDGVPINMHIPNIVDAISKCVVIDRNTRQQIRYIAVSAYDNFGIDIPSFIVFLIKHADFIVADISGRNASVMYELAIAHMLSKPTILLDYKGHSSQIPIYFSQKIVNEVQEYSVEDIAEKLGKSLQYVTFGEGHDYLEQSASDVIKLEAAAYGLAVAYFYNFVRLIISTDYGLIRTLEKERPDLNLKKLLIVKPRSISSILEEKNLLEKNLEIKYNSFDSRQFLRKIVYQTLDEYIISYPTPAISISEIPSYVSAVKSIQSFPVNDFATIDSFNGHLVDVFLNSVVSLAKETPGCDEGLIEFQSIADLGNRQTS